MALRGYVATITNSLFFSIALAMTPVASAASFQAVSEVECDVAPRDFDEIALLASTPAPDPPPIDPNSPASEEIVAAIMETVALTVACANANDLLRSFALFTDRYLATRFGPEHPDDLGSVEAALSREPAPAAEADRLWLIAIDDVLTVDENRATAIVTTANRIGRFTDRLTFELVSDRWLIDDWRALEDALATPTT